MSDIVKRLRGLPKITAGHAIEDIVDPVAYEAADEIERLRGLLEALAQRHEWVWPGMGPCVCKEHMAARAALATTDTVR